MTATVRIVIADDHTLIRRGLAEVLRAYSDLEVVGDARNGEEAVRQVERLDPDILIIDLEMPQMSGQEAISAVSERFPRTRSMVLTAYESSEHVYASLDAGAISYILKDSAPAEIVQAIRDVAQGESPMSPRAASQLLRKMKDPDQPDVSLSQREIEVLELVAKGMRNHDIGERLFLTENTIKSHLHRINQKFDVSTRTGAVTEAVRRGLMNVDLSQ